MSATIDTPMPNSESVENSSISTHEFETFKEAMIEENLALQVEIVRRLKPLAQALGEKATREELLPFIEENMDFHDEILFNLSDQLKNFMPLVGGVEHSKIVFDILAKLCVTDEILVREKSVEALRSFGEELTNEEVEQFLYPVLCHLVADDWFTSKCSALMLYSTVYPKLGEEKKEDLRNRFRTLIQDDSPMVRKAAALSCIDFIRCLETDYIKNEFVPIFLDIALDPSDTVRSITIDIALALTDLLKEDEIDESIIKIIEQASDDPSWRVREQLAESLPKIQQKVTHPKYRGKLIAIFQKLTQDLELEVRHLSAVNLYQFSRSLKNSYKNFNQFENNFEPVFEQSILPAMKRLILDESDHVRYAVSSNILHLSSLLSEHCFKKNILPLLMEVLEREDSMAIQANFLQSLGNVPQGVDLTPSLNSVKNALKTVIVRSQSNWRSRRNILMTFVDIARFCTPKYFSDHFKMYYAALLGDSVFAVRRNAALILPLLAKQYGIKWASENLIPYFTMFTKDTRYLYRYVPLFGINELIYPTLGIENKEYLNSLKNIIDDPENENHKNGLTCLSKIAKVTEKIVNQLDDEEFKNILEIKNDLSYKDCDINSYLEKDFSIYEDKYKNFDFYEVDKTDFHKENYTYLQGVLYLIYKRFLDVVKNLNKDNTENIQIRTVFTLSGIFTFVESIKKEINKPWVQQTLAKLSKQEIEKISTELENELKQAVTTQDIEIIDTNLMEAAPINDTNLPDLSKTILIENTVVTNAGTNQNIKETHNSGINQSIKEKGIAGTNQIIKTKQIDEDKSLVDEVLDILDKKLSVGSSKETNDSHNSEKDDPSA